MRPNWLNLFIITLVVVIFSTALISKPAFSQTKEKSILTTPLVSQTVPIGANIKLPDVPRFSVAGEPAIAFDGTNFLIAFSSPSNIYAMRISQSGVILDSPAISVAADNFSAVYAPSVIFDGTNYLMVWIATDESSNTELYGARLTTSGTLLSPGVVKLTTGAQPCSWKGSPGLVWNGAQLLVTWASYEIFAARFSPTLTNLDPPAGFVVLSGTEWNTFSVAFGGSYYLVAASGNPNQGESGNDILGARISPAGVVLDPGGFVIFTGPNEQNWPEVGFDGSNFLVTWVDYSLPVSDPSQTGVIFARRVSPAATLLDAVPIQAASQVFIWGIEPFDLICDATDCLLTWNSPSNLYREIDIWARRISQGLVQDPQAIPVAATYGQQYWPVVGGGSGHYLVAWTENVSRDCGSYAQLLERQSVTQSTAQPASPQRLLQSPGDQPVWYAENISSTGVTGGIAFSPSDNYAVSQAHIFSKRNGSWQIDWTLAQTGPSALWASGPNDIWLSGACMYQVIYNGSTWFDYACKFAPPEFGTQTSTSLWGSSPTDVWGTGVQGALFRSNGDHWQDWLFQPSGIPFDLDDLWGTSGSNVYAVGERGSILHYTGSAWVQQASNLTFQRLNAVWGSGPSDIFAVGDWGVILHFNGTTWAVMNSGSFAHLYGVWGNSATNVYAVGSQGTILHYDGIAWSAENSQTSMDLYSIWGSTGSLPVWAGGNGSKILILEYRNFLNFVIR